MQVSFSVVDEGLTEVVLEVVNRFQEIRNGVVGSLKGFTPFELDINRSATAGTNHTRIALKPSKRLLELVAAIGTSKGNLGVIQEA